MIRRQERTFDRKLLELAKNKHMEVYGDDQPINRVKIRRFKKELRKQWQDGTLIIDGFAPGTETA